MVPEVGGKSPVMQLNSVVLPAPLEPSTARRSPGRTVRGTSTRAASAPNNRVTPSNSSALPAPTAERLCATLSMAASPRQVLRTPAAVAPARPQSDHAVRRPEYDDQEAQADQQPKPVAIESDRHQEVECE